jgi:hypothetical protein
MSFTRIKHQKVMVGGASTPGWNYSKDDYFNWLSITIGIEFVHLFVVQVIIKIKPLENL